MLQDYFIDLVVNLLVGWDVFGFGSLIIN